MFELRGYIDEAGRHRFASWFDRLDAIAAAKVTMALTRLAQGNHSNVKSVGGGVREYKVDFGPGYRIYFGLAGDTLVILLGGGTKQRQDRDVAEARARWSDYKRRQKHAPYP